MQKPLFHRQTDGQTSMMKLVYPHNFVDGVYKNYSHCKQGLHIKQNASPSLIFNLSSSIFVF